MHIAAQVRQVVKIETIPLGKKDEKMTVQIKRSAFDFLVDDYKSKNPVPKLLNIWRPDCKEQVNSSYESDVAKEKGNFIQRWYLCLQGETNPRVSSSAVSQDPKTDQRIYRYDWTFGITATENYLWDWLGEMRDGSSIAVHMLLEPVGEAPMAVPISATLNTLHPSRNTRSTWELALHQLPKSLAEASKIGSTALPALDYFTPGLMMASNILESQTENQKNWFLYQFLDDKMKCPAVEWRIDKKVLREYGPLLHGSLFLVFYGNDKVNNNGVIRLSLRPQVGYFKDNELCFINPIEQLKQLRENCQVCMDIQIADMVEMTAT